MEVEKYTQSNNKGNKTRLHRLIAEKALGRPLPKGAEVHHIDGDGRNNNNVNLVICPSHAYHFLLHSRQKALEESGNANWRKCGICSKWDNPANMRLYKISALPSAQRRAFHGSCINSSYRKQKCAA